MGSGVGSMSPALRLVVALFGIGIFGYCAHSIRAGRFVGNFNRVYIRDDEPGSFWFAVAITAAIGGALLFEGVTGIKF
jgi:hypothetical protein